MALDEADRVLHLPEAPEGYVAAHKYISENYTQVDWKKLKKKRGNLFIQDYRDNWPKVITNSQYDLVTEYGAIGELETNQDFINIIKKSPSILKPGGYIMFLNFLEKEILEPEKKSVQNFTKKPSKKQAWR